MVGRLWIDELEKNAEESGCGLSEGMFAWTEENHDNP
jgi:hypothetical protein